MNAAQWMGSIFAQKSTCRPQIRLADTVLGWFERTRQRHALARMDTRMLADMGISRADALHEAEKPFWRE